MRLSDLVVRNLPSPLTGQKTHYDEALPNFGCRVSQGGTKTFVVRHGIERRMITLGRYPLLTLADARQLARERLAEIVLGKHRPKSVRWEDAVEEYLAECRIKNRASTVHEYARHLQRHFTYGRAQVCDVDYTRILHKLNQLEATPGERNHALSSVKIFLNWCKKPPRRYISANPCEGIAVRRRPPKTRVLSDAELQLIWRACEVGQSPVQQKSEEPRLPRHFATIVKLLILTGQRRGETGALRAEYFSNDLCTLPATLTKNGREHCFPLSGLATSIVSTALQASPAGFLFPERYGTHKPFCAFGKGKVALDKLSGVSGWTLHDLRRTFATRLAELDTPPHVIEALLNHITGTISPIARVYNLHKWIPQMRAAIENFEAYLLKYVIARPQCPILSLGSYGQVCTR